MVGTRARLENPWMAPSFTRLGGSWGGLSFGEGFPDRRDGQSAGPGAHSVCTGIVGSDPACLPPPLAIGLCLKARSEPVATV